MFITSYIFEISKLCKICYNAALKLLNTKKTQFMCNIFTIKEICCATFAPTACPLNMQLFYFIIRIIL